MSYLKFWKNKSNQLRLDPDYIEKLKQKYAIEDEDRQQAEQIIRMQTNKNLGNINISASYDMANNDSQMFDEDKLLEDSKQLNTMDEIKLEHELKKMYFVKHQLHDAPDEQLLHHGLDDITEEVMFSELDMKDNYSDIDSSIDNDFWENYEMED